MASREETFFEITGRGNVFEEELLRLGGDTNFTFGNRSFLSGIFGKKKKSVSRGKSFTRVSQDDFSDLLNLDLFRGGSLSDVTSTGLTTSTFKQSRDTGEIFRKGEELSLLDASGLEQLAEVVSGRQSQILGSSLAPGLERQSFSLFSGNFS